MAAIAINTSSAVVALVSALCALSLVAARPRNLVDKTCVKSCLQPHASKTLEELYCDEQNLDVYGTCSLNCFASKDTAMETLEQDWNSICIASPEGHGLRLISVDGLIAAIDLLGNNGKSRK